MRDTFAGDITDYLKFGLLRSLVEPLNGLHGRPPVRTKEYDEDAAFQLGVVWYQGPDKQAPPGALGANDLDLYQRLVKIREARHGTAALEQSGILPWDTVYYRDEVPLPRPRKGRADATRAARFEARMEWLDGALRATAGCEVVFLDPDSGFGDVSGVKVTEARARRFAFIAEAKHFVARGQSCLVFHYLGMRRPADEQIRLVLKLCGNAHAFGVRFRRGRGPRCLVVLPSRARDAALLRQRTLDAGKNRWKGCWTLVERP